MDFSPTETEVAVRGVAADVLEKGDGSWTALASAGLLGLAVPEEHGGDGLGLPEVGALLHEVARHGLPLPVWETLCGGVLPLVRCGTEEQQARLLPGVVSGEVRLTAALAEPGEALPAVPRTRLEGDGRTLRLSGRKVAVGGIEHAAAVLVPATRDDGTVAVVVLDPESAGVTLHPTRTSRGCARSGTRSASSSMPAAPTSGPSSGTPRRARWRERPTASASTSPTSSRSGRCGRRRARRASWGSCGR